jgi:magnesium-protoporphyrin IX monomethyl ester (oxidative) cyclase
MPLGLAYLAAFLEREGYKVKILDASVEAPEHEVELDENRIRFGLSFEAIQEVITSYSPDVVGVSMLYSCQADNGYAVCKVVKQVNQDILTVVGGADPTSQPEDVLKNPDIDFVVLGEGEIPMTSLLQCLQSGKSLEKIDGIGYRTEREVKIQPKIHFIEDLDSLPFPAWHLLAFGKYFAANCAHGTFRESPYAPVFTSRGCPYACTYCFTYNVHGRRFRMRSVQSILSEIETLMRDYGIKEVHFEDDSLTSDRKRAFDLFSELIKRKLNLLWTTPNGVAIATLDKDLLHLMQQSGCYKLIIAVESGSQRVLSKIMHKPLKLDKVTEIMGILAELNMPVALYWMLGLPGETKKEIEDSINLAVKLRSIHPMVYSSFSVFTPFKGTKLYKVCQENGYLKNELDHNKLKFCFSQISTPELSSEYIEKMRKVAWQRANGIRDDTDLEQSPHLAPWIPQK